MPTRKYSRLGRVRGCARPTLLIFSLVALSPPRTASGRAPSPRLFALQNGAELSSNLDFEKNKGYPIGYPLFLAEKERFEFYRIFLLGVF